MSMKKAIDQTLRDLKRGVNKKVLKVPSVEQKVLDATSNEPWGPHGSLLADIAQATRNYHEYQMIMSILWKRLNDTGKNWRHVYKALTVLEYLVANGSERVIDEIKEHAYQISTLSDFQYIDSSGRDQGNNVRRKSQSLVLLVNDKERIQEARDKAATNRDKFHSTSAGGGMYRPGSHSGSRGYGDDRHESQNDERYGRYGDPCSRDGDRYGRDFDDYGRDRYGDDDSRGRARSVDGYRHGSRSRSSDRNGDRSFEDDDRHSARGSVRGENHPDRRPIERKFSEQNLGAPPSYEEAVDISQSPSYSDRDGETPPVSAPQSSSPTINAAPHSSFPVADATPSSPNSVNRTQLTDDHDVPSHPNIKAHGFDEFDPRASFPAPPVPTSANAGEMDLLCSLSDAFSSSPLAIMPASNTSDVQPDFGKTDSHPSFIAASVNNVLNQPFEDPFGDSPFKAIPSEEAPSHPPNFASAPAVNPSEQSQPTAQKVEAPNLEFADTFSGLSFHPATPDIENPPNQQYLSEDDDILAGILPPAPLHRATSLGAFPASSGVPSGSASYTAFPPTSHTPAGHGFMTQVGSTATPYSQTLSHSFSFSAPSTPFNPHLTNQGPCGASIHQNNDLMGDMLPSSQLPSSNSTGSLSLVSLEQSSKEKFEPKSAVWADTLSRGLVNLNISGSKINPLSDIGIDFESLNRKEKRMEKPSATPATSNVNMGKAMGSGSGMGRAGVGGMRPPPNPMMGSGMGGSGMGVGIGMGGSGMGMGGSGAGMRMGGYGSMNQQPMGMGGMDMGMNNMGMAQGVMMQPPNGSTPGPNMNYNPMMGRGGYPQQPYGGAYRSM